MAEDARFYLDEDVPHSAADIGRSLGIDVIAAAEAGPLPLPDRIHLARAAEAGRTVVTYNRNDFIEETRDALGIGAPHAGVLILTRKLPRDPERISHALRRWLAEHGPMQPYEVQFLSG